jgi:hypothetical protein
MHYTAVLAGVIFATSGLALPLDTPGLDVSVDATLKPVVDVTKVDLPVSITTSAKRQIDLSIFSNLLGSLLGSPTTTLSGLLPTVVSTLDGVLATITGLLSGTTGTTDLDSTLGDVISVLAGLIAEIESLLGGAGLDLSSGTTQTTLATAIAEAEQLAASVQGLSGTVGPTDNLSQVESLCAQLVTMLSGLS